MNVASRVFPDCGKPLQAVIPSGARDLALSIFKAAQDSSPRSEWQAKPVFSQPLTPPFRPSDSKRQSTGKCWKIEAHSPR